MSQMHPFQSLQRPVREAYKKHHPPTCTKSECVSLQGISERYGKTVIIKLLFDSVAPES